LRVEVAQAFCHWADLAAADGRLSIWTTPASSPDGAGAEHFVGATILTLLALNKTDTSDVS